MVRLREVVPEPSLNHEDEGTPRGTRRSRPLTVSKFEQIEQVKRISAWAAILFASTLIGTIYGQNFANLPGAGET